MDVNARASGPSTIAGGEKNRGRWPVAVLLVGCDLGARAVLKWGLEATLKVRVIAEATSGSEAARLARKHNPEIVLIDALWNAGDCPAIIREIRAARPEARVVVLTARDRPVSIAEGDVNRTIDREIFMAALRPTVWELGRWGDAEALEARPRIGR
jgi:CheY-like chemotaxis protein